MLWQLQRETYNQQGILAWTTGGVPQSITTNPPTARAYARVVLGYLRDVDAEVDTSQPVYILELGAGSGRFGYRFVKFLSRLLQRCPLQHRRFTYVMTDISASMIDFWQGHPKLRPLVESGLVDFAVFDAARPADIRLVNSGLVLRPGEVVNPMLVLANYLFDSIPQDSFTITDGVLHENLVTIRSPSPAMTGTSLRSMQVSMASQPTRSDYYAEHTLDRILDGYRERLQNAIVLFPIDGMRCVKFFHEFAPRGVLFLIGDFGTTQESDVPAQFAGGISVDSNFWLSVNFHALGEYTLGLGGTVLHPPIRRVNLNISTFLLGRSSLDFAETALAYDEAIGQSGPDVIFETINMLVGQLQSMSRRQLLEFLRATGSDPDFVVPCLSPLIESLPTAPKSAAQDLRLVIEQALDMYYPMGDSSAVSKLAFGLGMVLYRLGEYEPALEYFIRSLGPEKTDPQTTLNVALCMNQLQRKSEAIEWLDRTLELDPSIDQAREMRATLLSGS
jgi:tetratricopeptide (TPR) repeat protein